MTHRFRLFLATAAVVAGLCSVMSAGAQDAAEIAFYQLVRTSSDPDELRAFLTRYPDSPFAPLVRKRLADLEKKAAADAQEKAKSQGEAQAQMEKEKARLARLASLPKPTRAAVLAIIEPYVTNPRLYPHPQKISGVTWRTLEIQDAVLHPLYNADYARYGSGGFEKHLAAVWHVHFVVDVEVDDGGRRLVRTTDHWLRMYDDADGRSGHAWGAI